MDLLFAVMSEEIGFQLWGADHLQVTETCAQKLPPKLVFIPTCSLLWGLIATIPVDRAPSFPDFPLRGLHRRRVSKNAEGLLCTEVSRRHMHETRCAEIRGNKTVPFYYELSVTRL